MTDDRAAEREAIAARVAELEAAQQHERPDDFMRLFRRDAVWVTAHGRRRAAPRPARGATDVGDGEGGRGLVIVAGQNTQVRDANP